MENYKHTISTGTKNNNLLHAKYVLIVISGQRLISNV